MSVIHAPQERPLDARQLIFPGLLVFAFCAFLLRLWYLQVVESPDLTERAERTGQQSEPKLAPRGIVVDRNGKLLAGVKPSLVILAKPAEIKKKGNDSLVRVAELLGVPIAKLKKALEEGRGRPYLFVPIFVGAPVSVATRIAEAPDRFPGLAVETQPMRFYPDTKTLAHVLGWVWTPNESDVDRLAQKGLEPAQYVGRDGIERKYEALLMGVPGSEKLRVDAKRRPLSSLGMDHPIAGRELMLSIDTDLQKVALAKLNGRKGAVVAIDPSNGEVLCLASSPTYDADLFRGGISSADYKMLTSDEDKPLVKRAIAGRYAPGSTFKIVTSISAELEGKFSTYSTAFCGGFFKLGNRKFRCLGHHGAISFQRAFEKSCNTYFADMAWRTGPDRIRAVCKDLNLCDQTGIDVPGEVAGRVPTLEWMASHHLKWYGGDTVQLGIGQGYLGLTPVQMASLAAFVANKGTSYRPHLLRSVMDPKNSSEPQNVQPEVMSHIELSAEFWSTLHRGLNGVIENGTAKIAQIQGIQWGGKTGSSEHRRGTRTHSWFVGFAPMDNPKIAIAVIVEAAGHGSEVAAPIGRDVVKRFLKGTEPIKVDASVKEILPRRVQAQSTRNAAASDSARAPRDASPSAR